MKYTIDTTDEQDAALDLSRQSAYPDEATRPSPEGFAQEVCSAKIDEHVSAWRERKIFSIRDEIAKKSARLTAEDLAEIAAVTAKYAAE